MTNHLTSTLFAAHGAGWPQPGQPVRLRLDHVLLDEDDGLVTLLAFEAIGRRRHAADLALVVPAQDAEGPDARDDLRYVQSAAAAIGAIFVRPGAGAPASIHRRGFTTPGRTLLASVPGAGGAGAFAMMVVAAEATEAAVVMAGESLELPRPPVLGVRLHGVLPHAAGGAEVLAALARRLDGGGKGCVIEYHGEGLAALPMPDRIAMASLGGTMLGAVASVFPSDALTHAYMVARGREGDWRRTGGGGEGFERAFDFNLSRVPPAPAATGRVRLGALAEDEDLRRLAAAARAGASLHALDVVVGGRAARAALVGDAVLEALESAGATVLDAGDGRARGPLEPGAWACGDDTEVGPERAVAVSCAAVLARLGASPATRPAAASGEGAVALDAAELIAPAPEGVESPIERGPAHVRPAASAAFAGSPRGVVLRADGGDVGADDVLARGPRARARRGDPAALAALSSRHEDAATAGRSAAEVWNVVTARGRYGDGEWHDAAARATRALGIRVVIAREFAPAHARALAVHGVLPLCWSRPEESALVAAGDELELPGAGEALGAGERMSVRDLTAGCAFGVRVALPPEWRAIVRAGGLLATISSGHTAVAGAA